MPTRPVFSVLDTDVPIRHADIHLVDMPGRRIGVFAREQAAGGVLEGADIALLEPLLDAVDGVRSVRDVLDLAATAETREEARRLLQQLLGTAVELPAAVGELERRIPHTEIVRFPMQEAYAVPRSYWSNAADVREALPGLLSESMSGPGFATALSRLHVLATMGADGRSFHGGGGETEMLPGRYRTGRERTHTAHPAMVAFVREQLRSLDLDDRLSLGRSFRSPSDAGLGRLSGDGCTYVLRAASPTWMATRLEELREALGRFRSAVDRGARTEIATSAAAFHHLFCHLHPFERINNSIAMNVVNTGLLEAGLGLLPHLFLDHYALRLDAERYQVVFRDALQRHAMPAGDASVSKASVAALARFRSHVAVLESKSPGTDKR